MSIRVQPDDPAASEPVSNRFGSARRAGWLVIALAIAALALAGLYVGWRPALQLGGRYFGRLPALLPEAAAIAIFTVTYLVVAIGRLPGFWLDRAGAALVGASLMVALGILP